MALDDLMKEQQFGCPLELTLSVISGKWKTLILHNLISGTKRFNELNKLIPKVTQRMLTMQLRELEADGIVHREVYAVVPPKTEYSLTEVGNSLCPVFEAMNKWGSEVMKNYNN
jgi:DNA-binding HxlR family transcriptional regulator